MKNSWNSYYVNNDSVLELIEKFSTLPVEGKKKIQEKIVKLLSYLIFKRIRGYKNKPYYDDLLQEGKIGLMKAIEDFDINRGLNFFKFAGWHIQHRINLYTNNQKRFLKDIKKQQKGGDEEIFNPFEKYEKIDQTKVLKRAIDCLPDIESKIIIMRFGIFGSNRYTLQQIGELFSVSRQYIQQLESKAILKLKKNQNIKEFYNM